MVHFLVALCLFAVFTAARAGETNPFAYGVQLPPGGLGDLAAKPDTDERRQSFPAQHGFDDRHAGFDDSETGRITRQEDGTVCIDIDGAGRRCDLRMRGDSLLLLSTNRGERFRFRVELGLRP